MKSLYLGLTVILITIQSELVHLEKLEKSQQVVLPSVTSSSVRLNRKIKYIKLIKNIILNFYHPSFI